MLDFNSELHSNQSHKLFESFQGYSIRGHTNLLQQKINE